MDVTAQAALKPVVSVKTKPVVVNGVEITREAIGQEVQNHPAGKPSDAWVAAARALAIRELLLQEARKLDLQPAPITDDEGRRETDEEALVRRVVDHEVVTPEPDETACRRYYEQNLRRFRSADLYEVSHILIAADPRDQAARRAAQEQSQALIEILTNAPEKFEAMAKVHSACPSREVGGNLGQIGPGQTVPEFEDALAAIPVGDMQCAAVESRYGCHIVRVNRHEAGRQLPLELVAPRIAQYLSEHVRRSAIRQYISVLAGRAEITGIDLAASASPLVQ
ncbi:MAG: peptidylprolyl isomerase [Hyphomicrobiaceae bacterium]